MFELVTIEVDTTIVVALLLFSAMVSCVLLVYIISKSRSGQVMLFFIYGQILTIIWTVFYIFEILAPTVDIRWFVVCIEFLPLTFTGYAFLHFAYSYTRHKLMKKKWLIMTLILPVLTYALVWTNPWHHLFYKEFHLHSEVFGPVTYLIIAMTMTYLLAAAFLFIDNKGTYSSSRQKQSMYFIIAVIIPVFVHAIHTFGIIDFGFTITLIFFPFSVLLIIVSVFKYKFLDVLPIAINDTIEGMLDGMLVVHNDGRIMDRNTVFFKNLFNIHSFINIMTFADFCSKIEPYIGGEQGIDELEKALNSRTSEVMKGTLSVKDPSGVIKSVHFTAKPIKDYSKEKKATLFTFFDMTDIYELYTRLEEKNAELTDANQRLQNHIQNIQQLTMEKERNLIMADIHDTLGHSMMELLALLEVTDFVIEQGQGDVMDKLEEAIEKGRNTLREIRAAVSRYKKMGGIT